MNIPKYLPHLSNHYDRMDEYHEIDPEVTKDQVITWFAVCFKKFKVKEFKDIQEVREYQLLALARVNPGGYYGVFETDFWGGMFNTLGMYTASFYRDWMPKNLQRSSEKVIRGRFNYLMQEVIFMFGKDWNI